MQKPVPKVLSKRITLKPKKKTINFRQEKREVF